VNVLRIQRNRVIIDQINEFISDRMASNHIRSKESMIKHTLIIDTSVAGKITFELPLCELKINPNVLFHLTLKLCDGEQHDFNDSDDMYRIQSIVLEYKIDHNDIETNPPTIQHRQKEIETLKEERSALCELMDRTLSEDDVKCQGIREKYSRFYEMKTIDEMNHEFDLINKQIQNNNLEMKRCGYKQHDENESVLQFQSVEMDGYEHINLGNGTQYSYVCNWYYEWVKSGPYGIKLTFEATT
jgi:hypothetical protein